MAKTLEELIENKDIALSMIIWAKQDITRLILSGLKESLLTQISVLRSKESSDSFDKGCMSGYAKAIKDLESLEFLSEEPNKEINDIQPTYPGKGE